MSWESPWAWVLGFAVLAGMVVFALWLGWGDGE